MKTHAFPIQFAKEAILQEQYTTALEVLKPLSEEQTNLEAQFLRAYLHFWDDKLTRPQAIQQLERIAEKGHAEANYILAVCPNLEAGYQFSLPTNAKQLNYLQRAVDAGSIYALTDLAECHLTGIIEDGDLRDLRTRLLDAFEMMSSKKKYPKLCFYLGKMLVQGLGGNVDIEKGLKTLAYCLNTQTQFYVLEGINLAINTLLATTGLSPKLKGALDLFIEKRDDLSPNYKPLWLSYLHDYCRRTLAYDLHGADFGSYCDFVFDHFVNLPNDFKTKKWDDYAEVSFDPVHLLHFYTELFQAPAVLLERYTIDQIIQGLEMGGIRGWQDWTIGCVMWHPDTTADDVIACRRAMVGLFKHLFNKPGLLDVGFMWWDIGYGVCSDRTKVEISKYDDEDRKRVIQSSFLTMTEVLHMKSYYAQKAAIHGLGHFGSDESKAVLRQYLDDNPDLPASLREYALDAIEGRIA